MSIEVDSILPLFCFKIPRLKVCLGLSQPFGQTHSTRLGSTSFLGSELTLRPWMRKHWVTSGTNLGRHQRRDENARGNDCDLLRHNFILCHGVRSVCSREKVCCGTLQEVYSVYGKSSSTQWRLSLPPKEGNTTKQEKEKQQHHPKGRKRPSSTTQQRRGKIEKKWKNKKNKKNGENTHVWSAMIQSVELPAHMAIFSLWPMPWNFLKHVPRALAFAFMSAYVMYSHHNLRLGVGLPIWKDSVFECIAASHSGRGLV